MTTSVPPISNMHLTVAAVIERNGKFLLVTDNTSAGYKLNQPAGHVEDNEDIIAAAIREVKEEAGINFHPEKLIGIYLYKLNNAQTYLRVCFKGSISGDIDNPKPLANDDGVVDAKWYTLEEIEQLQDQLRSVLVQKCIEDYLTGQEFDLSAISPYNNCCIND